MAINVGRNSKSRFYQEMVNSLIIEKGKIKGIRTALGIEIKAKSVVLTNGLFLMVKFILVIKLWWWKSGRECFAWNH
jgi:tRNA U34 5-carboxymethylaminomethyl modifying enzyme MnmG/GidA